MFEFGATSIAIIVVCVIAIILLLFLYLYISKKEKNAAAFGETPEMEETSAEEKDSAEAEAAAEEVSGPAAGEEPVTETAEASVEKAVWQTAEEAADKSADTLPKEDMVSEADLAEAVAALTEDWPQAGQEAEQQTETATDQEPQAATEVIEAAAEESAVPESINAASEQAAADEITETAAEEAAAPENNEPQPEQAAAAAPEKKGRKAEPDLSVFYQEIDEEDYEQVGTDVADAIALAFEQAVKPDADLQPAGAAAQSAGTAAQTAASVASAAAQSPADRHIPGTHVRGTAGAEETPRTHEAKDAAGALAAGTVKKAAPGSVRRVRRIEKKD